MKGRRKVEANRQREGSKAREPGNSWDKFCFTVGPLDQGGERKCRVVSEWD